MNKSIALKRYLTSFQRRFNFLPLSLGIGYGYVALGSLFFSSKAIVIKLAYEATTADAITLLTIRMLISMPIFIIIGAFVFKKKYYKQTTSAPWRIFWQAGLVGILGYWAASYLDFFGLNYVTAQFERLTLYTYPFFVMILGYAFFNQSLRPWGLYSFFISYCGLAFIFITEHMMTDGDALTGGLYVMASALCFALYQLLARQLIIQLTSILFTSIAMTTAGFISLIQYGLTHGMNITAIDPQIWFYGFVLATICTLIPSFLMNAGLGQIGAQATAVTGTLSPLFTIILAVIILGEPFGIIHAIGTLLVITGILLYTFFDAHSRSSRAIPG